MVLIRRATEADLSAITEIYNALLATTTHEWTEAPHTVEERAAWLRAQDVAGHPVLVAVIDDEVVGCASYGDFRDTAKWPGYLPVIEHSIHVREAQWGRGVGRTLMDALVDNARAAGKRVMVGAIDASNDGSIRFHERLGFVEVARMPQIGEKFGRRLDLVIVQRSIT